MTGAGCTVKGNRWACMLKMRWHINGVGVEFGSV